VGVTAVSRKVPGIKHVRSDNDKNNGNKNKNNNVVIVSIYSIPATAIQVIRSSCKAPLYFLTV
jgi:hypothetical protein